MNIRIPHGMTPDKARKKIESLLDRLQKRHADQLEVTDRSWSGNTLHFGFKARGIPAKGTISIEDSDVVIDGKVPLLARPFEGKIARAVEKEASSLFGSRRA